MADGLKRQACAAIIVGNCRRPRCGEAGPVHQVPDDNRADAAGEGDRRLHLDDTPINEASGAISPPDTTLASQRNVVLVGGTGTGKTHLAIAIARACIRSGARRASSTPPTRQPPGTESQGRAASLREHLALRPRRADELGYLPFAQPEGSCSSIRSKPRDPRRSSSPTNLAFGNGLRSSATRR